MHSTAHPNSHQFGTKFNWANVAMTVLVMLLFLIFLFLFLTLVAGTAQAQSAVPPTARQAATLPQFASRLAHPTPRQAASRASYPAPPRASYKNPRDGGARGHSGWPLDANEIYDNGPINGTTDAWTINFGFVVSDSFTAPNGGSSDSSMTFGAWLFPGDVLQTVEVSITSAEFGGTTYFDQVVSFTQSGCSGNQYGFNVCTETSSNLSTANLAAGTYWVNLSNAVVNNGDPVYWDENSGVGCGGQGCPSSASENGTGTIPSEAFTVLGGTTCQYPPCPQCVQNEPPAFKIIHNFSDSEQSPISGVAIDQVGRLFGASSGGNNGAGLAYELVPSGQNWIFTPLYNFPGGLLGRNPSAEILGPEKAIYGIADGGLQQCGGSGNQYCGVVYRLRPSPFACLTALCSWIEDAVYRFTGDPDGWKPDSPLVFDQVGNFYGTTQAGGVYGQGAVYELTPAGGSWSEKVIYSFTGGSDGGGPFTLLLGRDGNLYGTTFGGGGGGGVIFQLTPSGDHWTETIIASYDGCVESGNGGFCFPRLLKESAGNFYGTTEYTRYICPPYYCFWYYFNQIFRMSPSPTGWQFTTIDTTYYEYCVAFGVWCYNQGSALFEGLAIDAAGNLYGTADSTEIGYDRYYYRSYVFKQLGLYDEQGLVGFAGDDFGNVQVDATGKLYGTTGACGNSQGTVWQLTP